MRIYQGEVITLKKRVPTQYHRHLRVFSDKESKKLPPEQPWDHAIDLREGALVTLISKNIRLSQAEQVELQKFIKEHLARGTICPSKSPYAATFFFIRKKDGRLCPVQDYQPVNAWTIRNKYPLPLIPQQIDHLRGCTQFTKLDIC
jgi:hypothetical protein